MLSSASTKSTASESFGSLSNVTTFDSAGNVLDSQQVNSNFGYDQNGKISSGEGLFKGDNGYDESGKKSK